MRLGRIFGIMNLIVSMTMSGIFIYAVSVMDIDLPWDDNTPEYKIAVKCIAGVWGVGCVLGIIQLCIVTAPKTNNRGLHIANGVLLIFSIVVLPIFAVFIISIIIIALEKPPVKKTEVDEKDNLNIEY